MHFKHEVLDPRSTEEARTKNASLLGPKTLGVEVTIPELAAQCGLGNVDPQHSEKKDRAAIEEIPSLPPLPDGCTVVTVRADLDSIGSMALLELIRDGEDISGAVQERRTQIALYDRFAQGEWPGPKMFPSTSTPWPDGREYELAPIAAAVSDFKVSVGARVEMMREWLLHGTEPAGYRARVDAERTEMIRSLENGMISASTDDGRLAVVVSKHRAAMTVGYSLAPVVVALNPEMPTTNGPIRKFTIAQYKEGYVDMARVQSELNKLEPGWGGSRTIIGSSQKESSDMSMDDVSAIVRGNLATLSQAKNSSK